MMIYRCSVCERWSHAQRKPKSHRRFVRDHGQPPPTDFISHEPSGYDHLNGFTDDGGWFVVCGPFDSYEAVKVS